VIRQSQGLYLHRTTQHRKTRTNIYALSGIRTHDPSFRAIEDHAPDCAVNVTGHAGIWSAILGGEWLASRPGRFTHEERTVVSLDSRLGGPQSRSGRCGLKKNLALLGNEQQYSRLLLDLYTERTIEVEGTSREQKTAYC
jgi:hypothetical protein